MVPAWDAQKIGKSEEGNERKGIACSQPQAFYQTPFAHERKPIVKFDRLVTRQSKSEISHLIRIYNPAKAEEV